MKVGFTGTREGMTISQWESVTNIMGSLWHPSQVNEFHDGDCVGADTQAHGTAETQRRVRPVDIVLHGHPCNLKQFRAYNEYDRVHPVRPPLARNRIIVTNSDVMIAAPKEFEEVKRGSGTWATIRYTQLVKIPLYIVWPDGEIERGI